MLKQIKKKNYRYLINLIGNLDIFLLISTSDINLIGNLDIFLLISTSDINLIGNLDIFLLISTSDINLIGNLDIFLIMLYRKVESERTNCDNVDGS
jgi:hypothetical protein